MINKTKNYSLMIIGAMIISGIFPVAAILVTNRYLPDWFWMGESFHAFVEGAEAFSAIMLATLLLMSQLTGEAAYKVWIAYALLGMGVLKGFHASIIPGETSVWLHSTSILFGGLIFALVWLPEHTLPKTNSKHLIRFVLIAACGLGIYSIAFPSSLPDMLIREEPTLAMKIINMSAGILFLAAAAFFFITYKRKRENERLLFANFGLLFGVTSIFPYGLTPWSGGWWFLHFFTLIIYLYILKQTFVSFNQTREIDEKAYDELKQRLAERTKAVLKANQRLQAIEFRLGKVITSNAYSIVIINENGIVIFVNPAAKALFGRTSKEFIGQRFDYPIEPNQSSEIVIHKGDGEETVAHIRTVQLDWGGKITYLASCFDITEIVQLREKLKTMSFVDELTQINNRRGFIELAKQQIKIAERNNNIIMVIYADLDNLKSINDNMGHKAGDLALIDTADILRATFRRSDIIGRVGGDEFAILAVEAYKGNINTIDGRLQKNVDTHNDTKGRSYELSITIGIARYYPKSNLTIDELISQADEQMYMQKRRKKNTRRKEVAEMVNPV